MALCSGCGTSFNVLGVVYHCYRVDLEAYYCAHALVFAARVARVDRVPIPNLFGGRVVDPCIPLHHCVANKVAVDVDSVPHAEFTDAVVPARVNEAAPALLGLDKREQARCDVGAERVDGGVLSIAVVENVVYLPAVVFGLEREEGRVLVRGAVLCEHASVLLRHGVRRDAVGAHAARGILQLEHPLEAVVVVAVAGQYRGLGLGSRNRGQNMGSKRTRLAESERSVWFSW